MRRHSIAFASPFGQFHFKLGRSPRWWSVMGDGWVFLFGYWQGFCVRGDAFAWSLLLGWFEFTVMWGQQ